MNLTRAALISADPAKRIEFLRELSAREGIRVYGSEHDETLDPLPDQPMLRLIIDEVREQLGPDTKLLTQREGIPGVWVSFAIEDDEFWVALPRARIERQFPWQWIGWGVLCLGLSLVGAYWIVSRIARPLRRLTVASRTIGRGTWPEPVTEGGPDEIRELTGAFNTMSATLQRNEAERALLLAGVSHDLRTPLARMRLGVEMLEGGSDAPLAQGMVADIEDMDAIIDQFLAFARDGSSEATEPAGDVNAIISGIAERQARRGRPLAVDLAEVPRIALKPMAIQRLVTNLVDNALRYAGDDVAVRTEPAGDGVRLTVLDRGPGVPPDAAERLLQPFTRLDPSRSGGSGAGLGLAIVDRIARMHGGSVRLKPRDGGGLAVEVLLRRAPPVAVTPSNAPATTPATTPASSRGESSK